MSEIKCPHCGAQQTQDFGIMNCPSCGAVLMVDMEGQIQLMNSSADSSELPPVSESPSISNDGYQDFSHLPESEPPSQESHTLPEVVPEPAVALEPESEEYRDILAEHSAGEAAVVADSATENFQDIQDFANSDLPTSPLIYTLVIEGIDRGDLRKDLLEIFQDERFKLNARATLEQIKDGKLELSGLNAVKASVLVIRLRRLPLQISWRQHAYQG